MIEQRTPEWFSARKKRVTASMVGAILGTSPYMSRADAMRSMVRDALGAEREFTGNVATEWGNQNEEGAIFEYEMETTHETIKSGFIPFEDWAGCSPDRLIGADGGLEVKCPFYIRNDPTPVFKTWAQQEHYMAQVQFSMFVTGRKWWHAWQWTPHGTKLETIKPDTDWLDVNIPALRQFHAEFLHEVSENPQEHLEPLRLTIDTPDAHKMVQEYDQLADAIERATERKGELLAQIVAASKDRNAIFAGRKLTKIEKAGSVSYAKAIKALLPKADLTPYTGKPSSFWKLS